MKTQEAVSHSKKLYEKTKESNYFNIYWGTTGYTACYNDVTYLPVAISTTQPFYLKIDEEIYLCNISRDYIPKGCKAVLWMNNVVKSDKGIIPWFCSVDLEGMCVKDYKLFICQKSPIGPPIMLPVELYPKGLDKACISLNDVLKENDLYIDYDYAKDWKNYFKEEKE